MLLLLPDEDNPSKERIAFLCTVPSASGQPWLQIPRTSQLEEPEGYFMMEMWGRRADDVAHLLLLLEMAKEARRVADDV